MKKPFIFLLINLHQFLLLLYLFSQSISFLHAYTIIRLMLQIVTFIFVATSIGLHAQTNIALLTNNQAVIMYSADGINPLFSSTNKRFDCSAQFYAYSQTKIQYQQNTPYSLKIEGYSGTPSLTISTNHNSFIPSLDPPICNLNTCSVVIHNNCAAVISNDNYFDLVTITLDSLSFTYSVNCDISYNDTKFQLGQLIIIVIATIILTFSTFFARFNSFNGGGLQYDIKWILIISGSVLFVGLFSLFAAKPASVFMNVVSWISIFVSMTIVFIEILYAVFKTDFLRQSLIIKGITIRIIDIIGFLLSIPVAIGWWLSNKNWIISDIISICIIISMIKVFKFISFKTALVAYIIIIIIYSAGNIIIAVLYNQNYSNYMLLVDNNPYQFQIPVITRVYNQKCVWISITTIAFPGLLISYLRRFDKSRSTNIYFVTSIATYFLGSVVWWVVDTVSYYPVPFDAFCEPMMMLSFSLFAFKRKQLRTLWEGKFYDQQFLNKNEFEKMGIEMSSEIEKTDHFKQNLMKDMFFNMNQDSQLEKSQDVARNPRIDSDKL